MDWLADNVVGTIPLITEIREDARKNVSEAGVKTATDIKSLRTERKKT